MTIAHLCYIRALMFLRATLNGIDIFAGTIRNSRWPLKARCQALIDFDRRVTSAD